MITVHWICGCAQIRFQQMPSQNMWLCAFLSIASNYFAFGVVFALNRCVSHWHFVWFWDNLYIAFWDVFITEYMRIYQCVFINFDIAQSHRSSTMNVALFWMNLFCEQSNKWMDEKIYTLKQERFPSHTISAFCLLIRSKLAYAHDKSSMQWMEPIKFKYLYLFLTLLYIYGRNMNEQHLCKDIG